jgi:hypothetical protein
VKARMPATIKVGPHTFTVLRKTPNGDHGECDISNLKIGVKRGLKRSLAQDALLHEVLHACVHPDMPHEEEEFVTSVTPRLLQVMQDNPELIAFLAS